MEIPSVIQVVLVSKVLLQKATGPCFFLKMFHFSSKNLHLFNEQYFKMLLVMAFTLLNYY